MINDQRKFPILSTNSMGVAWIFVRGNTFGGRPRGVFGGGGISGRRRIFENLQKIPYENCKNALFSHIFQKDLKTTR